MIEDLLIIDESGALLYNWHPQGFVSNGKEDLLSGLSYSKIFKWKNRCKELIAHFINKFLIFS